MSKPRTSARRAPLTRSEQMARIRSRDTKPEKRLRKVLWSRGLRYRVHSPLLGTPDVVFAGPRVAVFVDGCFWHGCGEHYTAPASRANYWQQKLMRNQRRDEVVNEELASIGWRVIRVWEHEINNELPRVADRVEAAVRERSARTRRRV